MNEVAWVKWCGCVVWGMGLGASVCIARERSEALSNGPGLQNVKLSLERNHQEEMKKV